MLRFLSRERDLSASKVLSTERVRWENEGSFASEASACGQGLQMCLNVCRVLFFLFFYRLSLSLSFVFLTLAVTASGSQRAGFAERFRIAR